MSKVKIGLIVFDFASLFFGFAFQVGNRGSFFVAWKRAHARAGKWSIALSARIIALGKNYLAR